MNKETEPYKLTIKRETLRVLTPVELKLVAGGRPPPRTGTCTTRQSY